MNPPGLHPNSISRARAPHLTVADVQRAGGYDRAADAFADSSEYRLFVLRETGVEMVVEVIPAALRRTHSGPFRLGSMPCDCETARGRHHRRIELECCGGTALLECVEADLPASCRPEAGSATAGPS